MIPVVDAAMMVTLALPMAAAVATLRRPAWRAATATLVALTPMPALLAANVGAHPAALMLLSAGAASVVLPSARRQGRLVAAIVRRSTPPMLLALVALAVWRNVGGPSPAGTPPKADTPNVLLIVLDTVRADRFDLTDPGSRNAPRLAAFARGGVSFSQARSTAPWTLPSHASMLTGRRADTATEGRFGALKGSIPTLAEVLSARGFDTVGIVANTFFCSYFTGLDRGFSHYEDLPTTPRAALATTEIGGRLLDLFGQVAGDPSPRASRKNAEEVDRAFLRWLDRRPADASRPFLAFLNFYDAHDPYLVPEGARWRFGRRPNSSADRALFERWWARPDKLEVPEADIRRLLEGYDSCLAYLDDRVGRLLDALRRRKVLDETIVIITADHGEAFGEHDLYGHGCSLYDDQLRIPLAIVAPGLAPSGLVDAAPASLIDVPATVLSLIDSSPSILPGSPLLGRPSSRSPSYSSVSGPEPFPPNHGRSPVVAGPMESFVDDRLLKRILIRRSDGPPLEQIFDLTNDPGELDDLSGGKGSTGTSERNEQRRQESPK